MSQKTELQITLRPVTELVLNPRNARKHSSKQLAQIEASIGEFGFVNPILVDENDLVIAGHGRLMAARNLGLKEVPTIRVGHLDEDQKRGLALADNKIALNAGWDERLLSEELSYLCQIDIELDVSITGFETPEIDLVIGSATKEEAERDQEETLELPVIEQPVVRRGDLWKFGSHRLMCGDATKPEDIRGLMGNERAQMVFIDPPYNVPVDGHVCGSGRIRHREFVMASGELTGPQFIRFLSATFGNLVDHSVDGSIHYVCTDWRHVNAMLEAGQENYSDLKNLCVWNKTNAGMGSFYRSKHELVLVFKSGTGPHINNFELGQKGRYRTNVWDYPGVNTFREGRLEDLSRHPTVKPIAMVADAILDCSDRAGIILDTFLGSGTTLLAAERTGRRCFGVELDPVYVETTLLRWEEVTGCQARHACSGQTLEELRFERCTDDQAAPLALNKSVAQDAQAEPKDEE